MKEGKRRVGLTALRRCVQRVNLPERRPVPLSRICLRLQRSSPRIVSVKDQPLASADSVCCWLRFKWTTRRSVAILPLCVRPER